MAVSRNGPGLESRKEDLEFYLSKKGITMNRRFALVGMMALAIGVQAQTALIQDSGVPVPTTSLKFGPAVYDDFIMVCDGNDHYDKVLWYLVKNCRLQGTHTLDDVLNRIGKDRNDETICGEWGPWIHDRKGNIIGKFRNPPCPKKAKP